MKFKSLLAAAVVLALLLGTFVVGSYVSAQTKAKEMAYKGPQYEYKMEGMRLQPKWTDEGGKKVGADSEMEAMFNFHGAQGWEYAGVVPGKEDAIFVVFKRPKQ